MFSEWEKGITKEEFEQRLLCLNIQRFVYNMEDIFTLYLIDRQKREVTKILNEEIIKFFYHKIYMEQINLSDINVYLEIGNFTLKEWN
ncbi:MAG: hypothetical protein LUH21_25875 [Clostridiales bacterium]|nr:hypothetical protein [Clostridiales bacterium]